MNTMFLFGVLAALASEFTVGFFTLMIIAIRYSGKNKDIE